MKKTKLRTIAAALCAVSLLFGSFMSCSSGSDDDDGNGGNSNPGVSDPVVPTPEKQLSTHLVDFSNSGVQWSNGFKNNGGETGIGEQWVVYNHKVDLAEDVIVLKSKVNFNTTSGHTGVGFISVDGTSRKGYQLLSGQNIKNVGCTTGGSGQGFDTKVDGFAWTTNTDYVFEVTIKEGKISYVVYDTNGTELAAKKDTTIYHDASDIVYPAFGGTRGSAATYSDISVSINGKTVSIDGIDPQSQLATLSLDKSIVRINTAETATVTATATEAGASVPVTAESSDTSIASVSVSNNVITVTPVKMGSVKVTVKHTKADYLTASFDVVVADYPHSNIYGSLATVTYPAAASTNAYEDATLRLAFDAAPTLSNGGFISIYKEDGTLVDTITMIDEIQKTAAGNSIKVKNQLVRVDGNNVLITPHVGVIQPETKYFVGIPEGSITGKINGKDFNGLSNDKDADDSWSFTTRAAVAATSVMTVNASESSESDFRSINGALAAIGTEDTGSYTINVAAGTYYELINTKIAGTVKIVGPTNTLGDSVIIKYINHNDWNGGTAIRPSFYVGGAGNLVLENVTIWNATRRGVDTEAQEAQAEAIYFQSTGKLAAYNCSFKSYQDTIQVGNKGGKAWFYKCYIEGDVDYIWGTADVALFEECKFKTLNDDNRKTKTSDLLVARTYKQGSKIAKGFVVFNSEIEIENGMTQTFGRCAESGSDFWDQGAAINTKITGDGTLDPAFWQAKNYNPMKDHETFVGWKDYNITSANDQVISASSRCEKTYAISDEVYAKEFNGRRAILNRVYNVDEGVYVSGNAWDVEELEASWGASADESLNNVYDEEPAGSYMVEIGGDGTYSDGDMTVSVSTTNSNEHGAEVKKDGSSVIRISLPAGSYILAAGTCKHGNADNNYVLSCENADFTQEYIGTHTYTTEDCYKSGSRTDLYGDYYVVKSASDMVITLNSNSVKEYLPFIKAIKTPKYFVEIGGDGTYSNGDMAVSVSTTNSNEHGAEVKKDGSSVIRISLPAGSYILAAGTCKHGNADNNYVLSCENADFTQEYIGTHTYTTEDCYKSGSRTDLYGDYYVVKSASDMVITLNSNSVKEYLPFIGVEK